MDGDEKTAFRSYGGFGWGDTFTVLLSRPIAVRSLRVATGAEDGTDALTNGILEVSEDGTTWTRAGSFDAKGDLDAEIPFRERGDEIGALAQALVVFKDDALAKRRIEAEREAERRAKEERTQRITDATPDCCSLAPP